jgi:hypothetical protein
MQPVNEAKDDQVTAGVELLKIISVPKRDVFLQVALGGIEGHLASFYSPGGWYASLHEQLK